MKNPFTTDQSNRPQNSRNRAGMTLVESLIAITLLAIFMTGTCKLLVSHRKLLDMARDRYTAANIAKDRLELVRTLDFDQIPELNETAIQVDNSGVPSVQGHFQRATTISTLNTNLYKVVIAVAIQNRKTLAFDTSEETLNTYVSKHLN
jgi:prepilin-type N-terminal cleavage/methylation domain-containing protein